MGAKSMSRKRAVWTIVVVIVAVGVGWGIARPRPNVSSLLERATRVLLLPAPPADTNHPYFSAWHCQWCSNNDLLLLDMFTPSPPIHFNSSADVQAVLGRQPAKARRQAYLDLFSFSEAGALISPDGKKAIWSDLGGMDTVISLETRQRWRRRKSRQFWAIPSNPVWLSDSRRWAQLMAGSKSLYVVVESLDAPNAVCQTPIGYPRGTTSGFDLMQTRLLGCTTSGHILATPAETDSYHNSGPNRKICFFEFGVGNSAAGVHQYLVTLPKGGDGFDNDIAVAYNEDVELSPRGDRLASLDSCHQTEIGPDPMAVPVDTVLSCSSSSLHRTPHQSAGRQRRSCHCDLADDASGSGKTKC